MADLKLKIPTDHLPDNWAELGAAHFGCSEAKIKSVVYGSRFDLDVFDYMLNMAEKGKVEAESKITEIKNRVKAINQ